MTGGSFTYETLLWTLALLVSTAASLDRERTVYRGCRVAVNIPASGPSVQFSERPAEQTRAVLTDVSKGQVERLGSMLGPPGEDRRRRAKQTVSSSSQEMSGLGPAGAFQYSGNVVRRLSQLDIEPN